MYNTNPIYAICSTDYIQQQLALAQAQKFENEQHYKIMEVARKLDEFMRSLTEIAPQFQGDAVVACCTVLTKYF